MFFKRSNRIQNSIDTLIGAEARIEEMLIFLGGYVLMALYVAMSLNQMLVQVH